MGVPDAKKKQAAMGSLFGSFGIKPGGQAVIGSPEGEDITVGEEPISRSDSNYAMLQNTVLANGLGSDAVRAEAERIVISVDNKLLFEKNSSNISEKSLKFLAELSDVLKDSSGSIELKGYTDHTETMFEPSPSDAAMYLSAKRALAVLHYLAGKGQIRMSRIVAHGFGFPPKWKTTSNSGHERIGYVEIVLDNRNKVPFRLRVVRKLGRRLDINGFFFKMFGASDDKK
jgi:outer membrane protein OmpA-like peptidoglycan-associated protein